MNNHNPVMKCSIPAPHVKTLAKAINTLSKIGEELHVEFLADELVLRAVSAQKSAFGCFKFQADFFIEFRNDYVTRSRQFAHKDAHNRFRFHMKSLLPIFKPYNAAESQLEACEIEVDSGECQMHFSFVKKCRVVHKYTVCVMETTLLQTAYTRKDTKSHVIAPARLLHDIVNHFQSKVPEITLHFQEKWFTASNYTADVPDFHQVSQMELTLDMEEFEAYEIDQPTALTCTIREIKGIVSFLTTFTFPSDVTGSTVGLPVHLYFTEPGVPLLLYIESPNQYEASFVIATVEAGPDAPHHPDYQQQGNATPRSAPIPLPSNGSKALSASSRGKCQRSENDLTSANGQPQQTDDGSDSGPSASVSRRADVTTPASTSVTRKLIGYDSSSSLMTPRQTQQVAKEYLAADSDEEGDGDRDSDQEV